MSKTTVRSTIQALLEHINQTPDDSLLFRRVQSVYRLLNYYDNDGELRNEIGFENLLKGWQSLYLRKKIGRGNASNLDASLPTPAAVRSHVLQEHPDVLDRLGRAVILLEIDGALRKEDYAKVHKLVNAWYPFVENSRDRGALITAKAVAWEKNKQFGKALGAYEAIDELQSGLTHNVDYSSIKNELADSMASRSQSKSKLPTFKNTLELTGSAGELPVAMEVTDPYSNPFNPVTTVPFSLPQSHHVKVEVYNMLGRTVALLADRRYQAGHYKLPLHASGLSSGIYFIRVQIGKQMFNKKVTLIKWRFF